MVLLDENFVLMRTMKKCFLNLCNHQILLFKQQLKNRGGDYTVVSQADI